MIRANKIFLNVKEDNIRLNIPTDAIVLPSGEPYTGSYDVTPKVVSQELETRYKQMLDNVRVKQIPKYEVLNTKGGLTVTIGGDESYG